MKENPNSGLLDNLFRTELEAALNMNEKDKSLDAIRRIADTLSEIEIQLALNEFRSPVCLMPDKAL
jgi:hypothetical protein